MAVALTLSLASALIAAALVVGAAARAERRVPVRVRARRTSGVSDRRN